MNLSPTTKTQTSINRSVLLGDLLADSIEFIPDGFTDFLTGKVKQGDDG